MTRTDRIARLESTPAGRKALTCALDHAERVARLSVAQGRARGRGQSSKAKGRAVVQLVRDRLRDLLGIPESDMVVKATSMPGVDLYLSPSVRERFPYAIEAKGVEALNIWSALAQADAQADGQTPVVFFKRARSPLYVALSADVFILLCRGPVPSTPHEDHGEEKN